jgi:ABC-2 type transport system ATP-binding protein
MQTSGILSVEGFERTFDGGVHAVRGLSFTVEPGQVVVFLGPNGAGKTSTMKMLAGLLAATRGVARVLGHPAGCLPYAERSRLGYLPEVPHLYEALSPLEFLDFIADLHGLDPAEGRRRKHEMVELFGLGEERERRIRELSLGTRRRVALAGVFLHRPRLALLDEPTAGLDPRAAAQLKQYLMERARAGELTVFMSTHMLEMAEKLCDRVLILHRGKLVADGTLEALRAKAPSSGSLEEVFLALTRGGEGA